MKTLFIAPGSPWENGYSESFNSRLRDEFLDRELCTSVREAAVLAEQVRVEYNLERPHMSLGYLTPTRRMAMPRRPSMSFLKRGRTPAGRCDAEPASGGSFCCPSAAID